MCKTGVYIFFQTCESRSVCNFQTLHQFGVFALEPELRLCSKFHSINSPRDSQFHTWNVPLEVAPVWSWGSCRVIRLCRSCQLCTGSHRSSPLPARALGAVTGAVTLLAVLTPPAPPLTPCHRGCWAGKRWDWIRNPGKAAGAGWWNDTN